MRVAIAIVLVSSRIGEIFLYGRSTLRTDNNLVGGETEREGYGMEQIWGIASRNSEKGGRR